jgi:hypothetical protein
MTPPAKNPAARKKRSSATEHELRARYTLRGWNLTAHQAMGWSFTIQTHWPDDGTQALDLAWHYFKQLGLLETATARLLTRIYECLKRYTATELCEAIDAKHASLGETHEARLAKVQFISKPDNFFNPHDAALMKWMQKSQAYQKRLRSQRAKPAIASADVAAREARLLDVAAKATALGDRQRRDADAHARKVAAWYEFLWPTLAADEQNAAIQRAAGRLKDELARRDLTSKETEQFLRESARAAASASLQLHHKNRYADLRRQFEAQYVDRAGVVQSSALRSEARR